MNWKNWLMEKSACADGLAFADKFATAQEAWDALENPQWMFWWLRHGKIEETDKSKYVGLAIRFARSIEHLDTTGTAKACNDATQAYIDNPTPENEEKMNSASESAWASESASASAWANASARASAWTSARAGASIWASASASASASESESESESENKLQVRWIRETFPHPPVMNGVE